jgi:putative ABC transport system permease protein
MIKNYLKIALRNIKRHAAHSLLNITGMAIGMSCAILILLWVQDEWSYDRHFKNADNLYRVIETQNPLEGETSLLAISPEALSYTLKKEFPEIIRSSKLIHCPLALKKENNFIEQTVVAVDKDFLKMFDIEFIQGDINTALNEPHNIVLTEETAKKYFGNENALGKTLQSFDHVKTITGVIKSLPPNSHIQFGILIPVEWLKEMGGNLDDWSSRSYNYIELNKGSDSKIVGEKIQDLVKKNVKGSNSEIFLQNIKKIHLFSSRKYTFDISGNGDITYVRILSIIAIFILVIACINFMNLSTAQSAKRAKEIGIRKMAGAGRRKIVIQFFGESFLIVFIAHIIAMILVELLLPGFNILTGKQLDINYQSAGLYLSLITVVLFCGLLAGSYPALYLSTLKPLDTMKGIITKNPGNTKFRRVLVIFQFSIAVLLIISTLIVGKQLNYLQNENLGFNKDNIGYFMFPTRPGDPLLKSLKDELLENKDIVSVSNANPNTFNNEGTLNGFNWRGKLVNDDVLFHFLRSDEDYAKTLHIELKEGRFFSPEFSTDTNAVVINETAAKIMGFKNTVGEVITDPQGQKLNIIGVVKDFHFQSLHYKIEPLIMQLGDDNNFLIKINPGKILSAVEYIKKTYKSFNPPLPIDFHFLDDDFEKLYQAELRISKIFRYFTLLAIIISCLGLIGLSSYMTESKTKEIGIRKTNGAKAYEIFIVLSKEYIVWVLIATIIASPVAFYAMDKWLQNFAYRISIGWQVFILAGTLSIIIALLTVSIQSYSAASKNPVEALRYE